MRVISKKIAYDSLTSKIPGIIPSIMDSWEIPQLYKNCGELDEGEVYYSYASAVKRASEYNINPSQLEYKARFVQFDKENIIEFTIGNYGLIPSDVIIPSEIADNITDYTDIYVNIPNNNGGFYDLSWPKEESDPHYDGRKIISGGTEVKILTYSTLNKWYSFFKKYYELIKNPEYTKVYESALDYYNQEVTVKNEESEAYYKSLDDTFTARGGEDMYNWISNNCIIQYQIPEEFCNGWDATYLYYSDAIKWYHWLDAKNKQCITTDLEGNECCECKEFLKRGGSDFLVDLRNWINSVNFSQDYAINSASITIPISITNSIDDLGEMSIFSNKWKEEEDYHNTLSSDEESGGTVMHSPYIKYFKCSQCGYEAATTEFVGNRCPICHSEQHKIFDATLYETYMIKGGQEHTGHYYNDFKENAFKSDDWVNYTDYYIKNNIDEFSSYAISSFTYSPINGKIIYNPTEITRKVDIISNPDVCINGNTYDIINGKYVELCYSTNEIADLVYKKPTKLQIFSDGGVEYAVLNGKRKYVETNPEDPSIEKIYFLRESNCEDNGCNVSKGNYIIYDNCLYLVDDNNTVTIDDEEITLNYPTLDGYFDIEDSRFYLSGDTIVIQDSSEYDESLSSFTYTFRSVNDDKDSLRVFNISSIEVSSDKSYVTLHYLFDEHKCDIISGYTDSKLDLLRRKEITTDDLGNELPGYFKSIVDIPMKIVDGREVVDVEAASKMSKYNLPYDECVLDILYKVGEVSDLKLIGTDDDKKIFIGNIITDIKFYYVDELGKPIDSTIKAANEDDALEKIEECKATYEDWMNDVMFCDITYHMGAVIEKNGTTYTMNENIHTGVKYVDTVYVTKQVGTYYLNNDSQFTFNYYLLSQNVDTISITDLNSDVIWDASTYFEMYILRYNNEGKYDEKFSDFDNNNGVIVSPLLRTEFNLASSMPQNVEADIYIDRGINAAFEKHLKLQELRSMEALENYGNGWFKINEY